MAMTITRRHLVALLGASAGALTLGLAVTPAAAGDLKSYASGRFAFGIDGTFAGFIKSATARDVDVVSALGAETLGATHLSTISHEPITLELSPGQVSGTKLWDWIKTSIDGEVKRTSATLRGDGSAVTLQDAAVQSLTIPTLDGASKDAAYFTLTVAHGGASTVRGELTQPATANKSWLCSSFRLEIDGLPCERVAKIDSFTLTAAQPVKESQWPGAQRGPQRSPTKLRATIDARDLKPWRAWQDQVRALGSKSPARRGVVRLIGPENQELRLRLRGTQVSSLGNVAPRADGVARFEVELYVEEMVIETYSG